MLVGDIIIGLRDQAPDTCLTGNAPVLSAAIPVTSTGGTLSPGNTYYVVVTSANQWGETTSSGEIAVAIGGGQNAIQFTYQRQFASTIVRVYIGGVSGVYTAYVPLAPTPATQIVLGTTLNGAPPTVNRAYLPDTDGGFVSSYTVYRWLNEALGTLARVTNGIQDSCGIASVSGQRRYVAPGQWLRFDQCFYDGWELDLGNKAETFRNRNLTANISISLMVDAQSDTTRIELYWTPSRTSGGTTTTTALASGDSNGNINAPGGWLLQDGFAQVGQEILSYSAQTSNQLQNIIRGWSGTQVPSSLALGASVNELNIELTGYRMPYVYTVGQSASTLGVPPGWEPFLKMYMLGLFRDAEQERQEAKDLMDQATKGLEAWVKSNKPVAGPRQARMYGDSGIRGLVPGGLTGGIIIP